MSPAGRVLFPTATYPSGGASPKGNITRNFPEGGGGGDISAEAVSVDVAAEESAVDVGTMPVP